jgi:hypothetical protein
MCVFQLLGQLTDLHDTWEEPYAIEGHSKAVVIFL